MHALIFYYKLSFYWLFCLQIISVIFHFKSLKVNFHRYSASNAAFECNNDNKPTSKTNSISTVSTNVLESTEKYTRSYWKSSKEVQYFRSPINKSCTFNWTSLSFVVYFFSCTIFSAVYFIINRLPSIRVLYSSMALVSNITLFSFNY